ncbi:MAG: SDR family NAD(P)-dependent oxidoreductase, partial [Paracoccaceae bacterium]
MSKIALITGAARGIGLATAQKFAAQGYRVLMLDRDDTELEKAQKEVSGATALHFDISSTSAAHKIAETVEQSHGSIDALINNAGVAEFGRIETCDPNSWRRVMETNLDGMFFLSQALVPSLKKTKGSIVNI